MNYDQLVISPTPEFEPLFKLRIDHHPGKSPLFRAVSPSQQWQAMSATCLPLTNFGRSEVEFRWHLSSEGNLSVTLGQYVQLSF